MIQLLSQLKKAKGYYDANHFEKALPLLLKLEKVTQSDVKDFTVRRRICTLIGLIFYKQGSLHEAEKYFLLSLKAAKSSGEAELMYNSHDNLAAVYITLNRTHSAMENLQQAIALKEKNNKERDMSRGLIQLASLQLSIGNLGASCKALEKSKALIRKFRQSKYWAHWYFAQGTLFTKEQKLTEAIDSYNISARYAKRYKEPYVEARACHNRGDILMEAQKWKEAESGFKRSLEIARNNGMKLDELVSLCDLGRIALQKGDYPQCRNILTAVQKEATQYGNDQLQLAMESLASDLCEQEGDILSSLNHQRHHQKVYQKFYDKELSRTVLDIEAKYENEKALRKLKEAELHEAESELKALRSQMNPHFIFNAIGSMRHSLLAGDIEKTDSLMLRFSSLLRLILDTSRKPSMLLSENIELLHLYIQTEQTRNQNGFDYGIKVDKKLHPYSIHIPGLILQPLVENSIIHGLFHKTSGKGKLQIAFSKKNSYLQIQITDNGIGRKGAASFKKKEHTSHATNIITETLRLIWKQDDVSKYFLTKDRIDRKGQPMGTIVKVLIPIDFK